MALLAWAIGSGRAAEDAGGRVVEVRAAGSRAMSRGGVRLTALATRGTSSFASVVRRGGVVPAASLSGALVRTTCRSRVDSMSGFEPVVSFRARSGDILPE